MDYFIQLLVSGIAVGLVYGFIGMGFAMIYRATGVVNFAQGELMMLVAYIAFTLAGTFKLGFWPLLLASVAVSVFLGLLIEVLLIRPMLGQPVFSTVMVTIGLAVIIRSVVVLIWGADPMPLATGLSIEPIRIGPAGVYPAQLHALGIMAAVVTGLWAFFRYSRVGIAMRATANLQTVALLMGINVKRIFALSWALSAGLAAIAGVLVGVIYDLEPGMWLIGLRSFPAVILGGLDSVFGAALGGILIGVVENMSEGYIGRGMKEIAGFVLILIVLMVRPYGLFGKPHIERV
ncbi:MAG: branched-chain amino acid ABC transporter permease [Variovorax paradoxus]|nr:MAG: branched-chain amino acid ABC transporter permease [Variovorax paradoxus]PZQ03630.1 MAG: branched-chain amino acid ABC transporter permease [Variovorax paradoxus]